MTKKIWSWGLAVILTGKLSMAQSAVDIVKLDFDALKANKERVVAKDAMLMPAYYQLLKDADKALVYKPVTVMAKAQVPPSGDKHDYMSIGIYWWPDSSKPGGVPYIRKDGQVTPEVKDYADKTNLPMLSANVYLLSLAYYFSGEEKYAAHAKNLVDTWFLDTATRMNPNLNYGQAIKGITEGRAEGLIETRHFIYIMDALKILEGSRHFSPQTMAGMKQWFGDFLHWMQTSPNGLDEMHARNNHGVWYDAQRLAMAIFTGDSLLAKKIIASAASRLDQQLDESGSFPLEMERTNSFSYTLFILDAYMIIAQLAEEAGGDFWQLKTASGKSVDKAFRFVLPFVTGQQQWEGQQIRGVNLRSAFPVLLRAGTGLNCQPCKETIKEIAKADAEKLLINLL